MEHSAPVQSRSRADLVVEKLRRKVSTVGPLHGSRVGVDAQADEDLLIPQGLEDRPVKLFRQIDLALGPVLEPEPDGVTTNVTSLGDVDHTCSRVQVWFFGVGLRGAEPQQTQDASSLLSS